ncbi:phosphatase PAP2 family protein [Cognatishimia sp. F0-27]|nr:phosphatase PAP2 family protein [Cognatishimia sp. F0-27]
MARDGTIGHWDGSADRVPPAPRDSWAALRALGTNPRRSVIDTTLQSLFQVRVEADQSAGHVMIAGHADPLVTLECPDDALLRDNQLGFLRAAADLRPDRLSEIIMQTDDIQTFFAGVSYLAPDGTKWTLALNQALFRLCTATVHPLKHGLDVLRPITLSRKLQPIIQTPPHGAWPSGHATEAFASATLLTRLFYDGPFDPVGQIAAGNMLYRHAARIAQNRTVAGVHFPTDSMAGAVLGITLAEAVVRLLDGEKTTPTRVFKGGAYKEDFNLSLLNSALQQSAQIETGEAQISGVTLPDWCRALWDTAQSER